MAFERVSGGDVDDLRAFLHDVDLTLAGLDEPTVRLWMERNDNGALVGSTGFELSADGEHALIRSVAVAPEHRTAGAGSRLARYAMDQARPRGVAARRAPCAPLRDERPART